MIAAISYDGMIKAIAAFLDEESGVSSDRILNADSIRGADLAEMISSSQSYSPIAGSAFMLFEVVENPENDFLTQGKSASKMDAIQTYDLHLKIYGNSSPSAAQKASLAFKKPENAMSLRDKGLFVNGVMPIEAQNEFINNTWVLRRDIIVRIQARSEYEDASQDPGFFDETQAIDALVINEANA